MSVRSTRTVGAVASFGLPHGVTGVVWPSGAVECRGCLGGETWPSPPASADTLLELLRLPVACRRQVAPENEGSPRWCGGPDADRSTGFAAKRELNSGG